MTTGAHCDLCDLPLAYCPHGQPKPPPAPEPEPKPKAAPRPRKTPARTPAKASAPVVAKRTAPRRWTPPEELAAAVVVILTEAGGELSNDDALAALEEMLGDRLTTGDRDKAPTGELRWHLAARKARQQLIAEGQMVKAKPGIWTLA